MREIKFRGWDKSYGKMTEPFTLWETPTVISFSESGGHMLDITESTPLMQFTGLKDKNGKEIYEGDIIETPNGFVGKVVHGTHAYKTKTDRYECAGWLFKRIIDGHIEFLDSEITAGVVVGNIHENPEPTAP